MMLMNKFSVYLDAKTLYGWPMSKYLPYGGFKWLSQKEISFDRKKKKKDLM